jgi:hypothetical protein
MKTKQNLLNDVWEIPRRTKLNCYAFSLGMGYGKGKVWGNRRHYKARPGDKCPEFRNQPFDFQRCEDIVKRVLCDNPRYVTKVPDHKYREYLNKDLGPDHHLIAAYLSPGNPLTGAGTDFHFTRRVPLDVIANAWARFKQNTPEETQNELIVKQPKYLHVHQRGWSSGGPLMYDASRRLILDPKKANMNYGEVNYSLFCGLFVVQTRMASVTDEFNY